MVIGVIGIGTAGLQSLAYMLGHYPDDMKIVSIYDPNTKILGIGESTTTFLPYTLSTGLDFTFLDDGPLLDATVKHGVKYSNWTEEEFHSHILPPYHGIHFNNFKLGEFVLSRAREFYPERFSELTGKIENITQDSDKVTITINDELYDFDYIVDCTGYPLDYSDYTVYEDMPVNKCFVNMVQEPGDWNYTHHYATENGWMFGIPLQTRQGWGYLFNDNITTDNEAKQDIAKLFNTNVKDLSLREFKFKNYHSNNIINGRIALNGNKALFFEPLEALSGTFYEAVVVEFSEVIFGNKTSEHANRKLISHAHVYKDFICFVYSGGSTYDSKFWNITKEKVKLHLEQSESFIDIVKRMRSINSWEYANERIVMFPVSIDLWNLIDKEMKLGRFS